jgi:hypothetical protein
VGIILSINKTLSIIPYLSSQMDLSNLDLLINCYHSYKTINSSKFGEILKVLGDDYMRFSPRSVWFYWYNSAFSFVIYDDDREKELDLFPFWNYSKLEAGEAYCSKSLSDSWNVYLLFNYIYI